MSNFFYNTIVTKIKNKNCYERKLLKKLSLEKALVQSVSRI